MRWLCPALASAALSACLLGTSTDAPSGSAMHAEHRVFDEDAGIMKIHKLARVAGVACAQYRLGDAPPMCHEGSLEELCRRARESGLGQLCARTLGELPPDTFCSRGGFQYERVCNTCGGINVQRRGAWGRTLWSYDPHGALIGTMFFDDVPMGACMQAIHDDPESFAPVVSELIECPDDE